jgi:hypothetical protein
MSERILKLDKVVLPNLAQIVFFNRNIDSFVRPEMTALRELKFFILLKWRETSIQCPVTTSGLFRRGERNSTLGF